MRKFLCLTLCALLFAAVLPGGVSTVAAQEAKAEFTLDEIVVTAERREASAQDTPVAVTALDESILDEQDIGGSLDLQTRMPSTRITTTIEIRGVGQPMSQLGIDAGVGIYRDGYYETQTGVFNDLFDVERIEIVRGPQGTLYGRNTIGGAINLQYVKPTDEWSGQLKAIIGNNETRRFYAAFGGPLFTDKFKYRLVYKNRYSGGWQENVSNGDKYGNEDNYEVNVKLLFEPTESLSFYGRYFYDYANENPRASVRFDPLDTDVENYWYPDLAAAGVTLAGSWFTNPTYQHTIPNPSVEDPFKCDVDVAPQYYATNKGGELTTTLDLGNLAINYLVMYKHRERLSINDDDQTSSEKIRYTLIPVTNYSWSNELQFVYGGDSRLSFIGGLYYWNEHGSLTYDLIHTGPYYWESILDDPNVMVGPISVPYIADKNERRIYWFDTWLDAESKAVYGQADYQFTDKLNATLGLRYAVDYKKGYELRWYLYFPPAPTPGTAAPVDQLPPGYNPLGRTNYYHGYPIWLHDYYDALAMLGINIDAKEEYYHKGDWDAFLYRFAIDYKPFEDSLIYASIANGYRSGGFSLGSLSTVLFDPEFTTNYEIGWKQGWMNSRFRTNTTLYYYDMKDQQVTIRIGNAPFTTNADVSEMYGAELETQGYITENLLMGITYSFTAAEYTEYTAFDQTRPNEGIDEDGDGTPDGVFDLSGKQMQNVPRNRFSATATYTVPTDFGEFAVSANYYWIDELWTRPFQTWREYTKPWDIVNARVMWNSPGFAWRVTGYVDNIFDSAQRIGTGIGGPYQGYKRYGSVNPPREFGIEVSYKW